MSDTISNIGKNLLIIFFIRTGDDLMTMERTRLAAMPEQRRLIYTLNRFENKTSPEIANELNLSCRTVENHLFLGRREMREFFRNCI